MNEVEKLGYEKDGRLPFYDVSGVYLYIGSQVWHSRHNRLVVGLITECSIPYAKEMLVKIEDEFGAVWHRVSLGKKTNHLLRI